MKNIELNYNTTGSVPLTVLSLLTVVTSWFFQKWITWIYAI